MYFLGVDIGGTKTAAGIIDDQGRVIVQSRKATPASAGGTVVLETAIALASSLLDDFDGEITAVGIGAGGQIDSETDTVVSATDLLPDWAGQAVGPAFSCVLSLPAFVENDVNALALGEYRFGAAREVEQFAYLALGTGVGGAFVQNGHPLRGAHWAGGEFGHMIISIDNNARLDHGGHKGTLEAYASGHGLIETWREVTGDRTPVTGEEIAAYAEEDDGGPANLVVAQTGQYLGLGLVTIVSLFDPDLIVIGGGLAALGDRMLEPARKTLRERALAGPSACPVMVSALGAESSVIGAAAVAMTALQIV